VCHGGGNVTDVWQRYTSPKQFRHLQKDATKAWGVKAHNDVFFDLSAEQQYIITDFGSPVGRAWMYTLPTQAGRRFSDATVVLQLRFLLGVGMEDYNPYGPNGRCPCRVNRVWTPLHAMSCMQRRPKAIRTCKHHKLKHGIANLARGVDVTVATEDPIHALAPRDPEDRVMDLIFRHFEPKTLYMDITVVGPSQQVRYGQPLTRARAEQEVENLRTRQERRVAEDARRGGRGRFDIRSPDEDVIQQRYSNPMRIAARRLLIGRLLATRENEKHRKYDRIVADIDDDEDKEFRPLVLSAGGTLSRTTKLLVDTLSRTQITRDLMDPNQAGKADPAYGHAASTLRNFAFQLLTKQILFRQADFFNGGVRRRRVV
jgi:hypothetical protein